MVLRSLRSCQTPALKVALTAALPHLEQQIARGGYTTKKR